MCDRRAPESVFTPYGMIATMSASLCVRTIQRAFVALLDDDCRWNNIATIYLHMDIYKQSNTHTHTLTSNTHMLWSRKYLINTKS